MTLKASLLDGSGRLRLLGGLTCRLVGPDPRRAQSVAGQPLQLENLAPGSYRLFLSGRGFAPLEARLRVRPGARQTLRVDLERLWRLPEPSPGLEPELRAAPGAAWVRRGLARAGSGFLAGALGAFFETVLEKAIKGAIGALLP